VSERGGELYGESMQRGYAAVELGAAHAASRRGEYAKRGRTDAGSLAAAS
jgi:hypothetical protein